LLARRSAQSQTLAERLFVMMMLGDDRAVAQTYVMGERVHGGQSD
jgi:guanine deaminase